MMEQNTSKQNFKNKKNTYPNTESLASTYDFEILIRACVLQTP